mgnify:CR=1 FL=1
MNNNEFFELCINRGFSNIEITIYDNKEYVSEVENEKINFIVIKNNIFYKWIFLAFFFKKAFTSFSLVRIIKNKGEI